MRDCNEGEQTDFFDHELTFGEEFAGEALEQVCLDKFTRQAEVAQLWSVQERGDAERELWGKP